MDITFLSIKYFQYENRCYNGEQYPCHGAVAPSQILYLNTMKQKPLVFYQYLFTNHVNSGPYLFRGPSESFTIRTNEISLIEQPKLVQSPITRTTPGWSVFNGKRYRQTNSLEKHTVLSRIVAPSLIVPPLFFQPRSML